ncbi:MAG: PD-(D/E)XK nuclease family protein [Chitinophagales bacterium]
MEDFVNNSNTILNDFIKIEKEYLTSLVRLGKVVVEDFLKIQNATKKVNKDTSFLFNPLKEYFNINETLHSYMLADLLNPNSNHGQGKLFLNAFLKKLDVLDPEKGNWTITAEKGRIDILLKRDNPHSVIIIENKSNNAVDQNHQLYRYWYQEIYLPNNDEEFAKPAIYEKIDISSRYKILYLPPDHTKNPQDYSLTKPEYLTDSILPNRIPINYEKKPFNDFICNWLKECIYTIVDENEKLQIPINHRLKEYLEQYIELWN